jgi:hypothetical protein
VQIHQVVVDRKERNREREQRADQAEAGRQPPKPAVWPLGRGCSRPVAFPREGRHMFWCCFPGIDHGWTLEPVGEWCGAGGLSVS